MEKGNNSSFDKVPLSRRTFVKVVGLTVPVIAASLSGCRKTDTLTKTVYDKASKDVDYDNPLKYYNNVPNADPTPNLPKLYNTDSEKTETKVELPEFEKEIQKKQTASETVYDENADSNEENSTGTGKKDDKDGNGKNDKGDSEEDRYASADSLSSKTTQGSVGGDAVGKEASKDVTSEPEANGSIIAFGEVANIVALLGGGDYLWSCDSTFYKASEALYGSKFVSKVKDGYWGEYKAGASGITKKKFKKLCRNLSDLDKDKRPKYLIYDGSIGCPVSKSQAAALEKGYGIITTYFFLNQVPYLKNAMNYVQKIIDTSEATQKYNDYWKFHDGLLSHLKDMNGGIAAYNSDDNGRKSFKDWGSVKAGDAMDSDSMKWTLLIDQWDYSAKYSCEYDLSSLNGLGVCNLGWKWSPASYYMQCGGVMNNAAARLQNLTFTKRNYINYAWAMGTYYAMPTSKRISGADIDVNELESAANDDSVGVLMCTQDGSAGIGKLDSLKKFPTAVVTTSKAKSALEYDRDNGGVYAGHFVDAGVTPNNKYDACGIVTKHTGLSIWTDYVGWASNATDEYGEDSDVGVIASSKYRTNTEAYDVVVNPHGQYSSWIKGSVESVLEAAWAFETLCQKYTDSENRKSFNYEGCSSTKELVTYFYKTFYGNAPKDVSKILSGGYAQ